MNEDQSFKAWKDEVNRICGHHLYVDLDDLIDFPFRTWFDSGLTPQEAFDEIREAIEEGL